MDDPIHITLQGQTVDEIALQVYGTTARATEHLLSANPQLRGQPIRLPAGLRLTCPPLPAEATRGPLNLWE